MALKFGAGEATGLTAGSGVGDATRPAEDGAIQREDAAALQELDVCHYQQEVVGAQDGLCWVKTGLVGQVVQTPAILIVRDLLMTPEKAKCR